MFKRIMMFGALLLLIAACGNNNQPTIPAPFAGPVWEWVGTGYSSGSTLGVPDPTKYTIQFATDNTFTGRADCNSINGTYSWNNNSLKIKLGASTKAACPPDSLDTQFTSQLAAADTFLTHPNELVIFLERNAGNMQFRASSSAPTAAPPAQPSPLPVTAIPTAVPIVPTAAPPTKTPPPACAGLPQIEFFLSEPATIVRGQNSVLRWGKVFNATSVAIDQGIGGVGTPGSVIVAPNNTTQYTMTAVGCGGTVQVAATVKVIEPTAPPAPTNAPTQPPPTAKPTQPPPPTEKPTQPPAPTEQPGANLLGLWRWTGTRLQDGTTVAPTAGTYNITFNANNTANIQADCNQGTATWSVSGNQLSIVIGAVTSALCGDGSHADKYIRWLGEASTYSVQGPNLTIVLKQDTGNMNFTR